MSETQQARGGFVQFMTTVPGILTAIAAIITAAGGIYIGSHRDGSSAGTTNLVMTAGGAPATVTYVDPQTLRLSNASADVSALGSNDPVQGLVGQCAAGDDGACASILDMLAQECADGVGASCDALFQLSPEGSDYQAYGASCGDRWPSEDVAGLCSQQ